MGVQDCLLLQASALCAAGTFVLAQHGHRKSCRGFNHSCGLQVHTGGHDTLLLKLAGLSCFVPTVPSSMGTIKPVSPTVVHKHQLKRSLRGRRGPHHSWGRRMS